MKIAEFKDYKILASGGGRKLEDWAGVKLLRPDPQAIWPASFEFETYPGLHAVYDRSAEGGGRWRTLKAFPAEWAIAWEYKDVRLKFKLKPMGFKHTGLFPEQAVNWRRIIDLVRGTGRPVNVLNLFAYTGGATLAALAAGASVCHVDAAKAMTDRAGENADLSKLNRENLRLIVDDCFKFVAREIRRGKRYDAVIMDPPSFGRGPGGEVWKLEDGLPALISECGKLLSDRPLFFLVNSYTTGLQPSVLSNLLNIGLKKSGAPAECYEVILPTEEKGIVLPCGASGLRIF
ncbi:SAM-dependent methyltransferase [Clostridia bacterium]|nr:SAM-dependent methyltransferase [Clostridia bacterium]